MGSVEFIIKGGRIINPSTGVACVGDVGLKGGKIAEIDFNCSLSLNNPSDVFDASGCIVTPGLIDLHVHAYEHATPLGINVDAHCLTRGVTTVVDAGSAGAATFAGLRKFIAEVSKTRVLAFLHIANHGLASAGCAGLVPGGEIDSLVQADVEQCVKCIGDNRDMIVGVKLRLARAISNDGANEEEAYRRAREAAGKCGVPLMVHHAFSTVPVNSTEGRSSCPGSLKSGDIYTHCLHGNNGTMELQTRTFLPEVVDAKKRGILFDTGHGRGSFNWNFAESAAKLKDWPDTISTDLHTESLPSPAYDLVTVMTKMLHVGMPLYDVIAAVTSTPARAIGWEKVIGSLEVGREADITVMRLEDWDVKLEDCHNQLRTIEKKLVPVAVWRSGVKHPIVEHIKCPNPEVAATLAGIWHDQVMRDETMPPNSV
ncbi:deacetylase Oant_2987-like [Gigantopelta aegis]|uniref:deacetylase Oant_2987-like n=1 Tax=Gigantopelta aegis TaxID=1735272 RepID=UPI001B88D73F|nr:deacetylase Oant_2987-like [Gigantopelta aegis]